jgi:hypothetical protein
MPTLRSLSLLLLFCALFAGCPRELVMAEDTGFRDGAPALDSSTPDAVDVPDTSLADAESVDRGFFDAGSRDSEVSDRAPTDASCVPECGARRCGSDPRCGVSCGSCDPGEACTADGLCLEQCQAGARQCTQDGFGYQACGYNSALALNDFGPRVACAPSDACSTSTGDCERRSCVTGEVMIVLDRSSSMSFNSTWLWVRDTILSEVEGRDQANAFGLRQFPSGSCGAGSPIAPQIGAASRIRSSLVDPGAEASSPIEASLMGLASSFGPARDGQAVILVSDGGETCGTADGAVRAASQLFRAGIRVFTIAINTTADRTFLDRIAAAGGTRRSRLAMDLSTMTATLAATFAELGACRDPHAQVSAGTYHTCGLRTDGTIACWGRDLSGESTPPSGTFRHIAAGGGHTCAVRTTGEVACWGRNDRGQLIAPSGTFVAVASGDQHSCGLKLDQTVACWGYNDARQATPPSGLFKQITCGGFFSCGVRPDDTVECWGDGIPRPSGPVKSIDGGTFQLCAILPDDTLECSGQSPATPSGTFREIAAGDDHNCAIETDGTITCWGLNIYGQINAPMGRYAHVTANYYHSCAVREADDAWVCWGYDGDGQSSPPP